MVISSSQSRVVIEKHLDGLMPFLSRSIQPSQTLVAVVDSKVAELYGHYFSFPTILIDASEENKTLQTVDYVIHELLKLQIDRNCFLLGIGGGITTDIVGFVAAIYKRGVDCGLVPTSLLAMVDAAIGGKNGVNVHHLKNMVGTFRQPRFTYICTQFLYSLPIREYRAALSEILKVFLIDGRYFAEAVTFFTQTSFPALLQNDACVQCLTDLMIKAINIKCEIVEKDELEHGCRRLLNLGHTFAHAIESCTTQYVHGEAVAMGLVLAAYNAQSLLTEELIRSLEQLHLPTRVPDDISTQQLADAVCNDKKNTDTLVNVLLLKDIGKVKIQTMNATDLQWHW